MAIIRGRRVALSYRDAQLAARRSIAEWSPRVAAQVERALRDYANTAARELRKLPLGASERKAQELTVKITREAAHSLDVALHAAVANGRNVAFDSVLDIWKRASLAVARAEGIPLALLGNVRFPPITMLGAYDSLGTGAATWRTALSRNANAAARDLNEVVRHALANGASPEALARRITPYMVGSETFHKAFGKQAFPMLQDFRKVPSAYRDAARKARHNALRIAFTETHNARLEAELQHFLFDPAIEAVQWTLAADRGTARVPDICDVYAASDFYGLGAGIYPLDVVPLPPHPWDRCELTPIERPPNEYDQEKVSGRTFDPRGFEIGPYDLTDEQRARLVNQLRDNVAALERGLAPRRDAAVNAARIAAPSIPLPPVQELIAVGDTMIPGMDTLRGERWSSNPLVARDRFIEKLKELAGPNITAEYRYLFGDIEMEGEGRLGEHAARNREVVFSERVTNGLQRYLNGARDEDAYVGASVTVHETMHTTSPLATWNRNSGVGWKGLTPNEKSAYHFWEEGMVERRTQRAMSELWETQPSRGWSKFYQHEVEAVKQYTRIFGEDGFEELWEIGDPRLRAKKVLENTRELVVESMRTLHIHSRIVDEFESLDAMHSPFQMPSWYVPGKQMSAFEREVLTTKTPAARRKALLSWLSDWFGVA